MPPPAPSARLPMLLRKLSGCVPPMLETKTKRLTPAALAASICIFAPSQSTSSGVPGLWFGFGVRVRVHFKAGLGLGFDLLGRTARGEAELRAARLGAAQHGLLKEELDLHATHAVTVMHCSGGARESVCTAHEGAQASSSGSCPTGQQSAPQDSYG